MQCEISLSAKTSSKTKDATASRRGSSIDFLAALWPRQEGFGRCYKSSGKIFGFRSLSKSTVACHTLRYFLRAYARRQSNALLFAIRSSPFTSSLTSSTSARSSSTTRSCAASGIDSIILQRFGHSGRAARTTSRLDPIST